MKSQGKPVKNQVRIHSLSTHAAGSPSQSAIASISGRRQRTRYATPHGKRASSETKAAVTNTATTGPLPYWLMLIKTQETPTPK